MVFVISTHEMQDECEWLQQVQDEVAKEMGIPWSYQGTLNGYLVAGQVASTNNVTAKGTELEINFNPSPSGTLAASATDMRAINTNVSGDIATWLRQRRKWAPFPEHR